MTGRILAGRYEILERIGEGASAEVFRARDHRLDRIVAVKVLRPQYGQDDGARARFAVEARSAAALTLPNVVPVYDFGAAEDGSLFIVMRLIQGPSLRRTLAERGALPPRDAVAIGEQVARALAGAHAHGLIHRDVKPGNILIDASGDAHLTDFGIVKALTTASALTMTGQAFGTAAYLSPEQATGAGVGPRSDIYSLGVVLYEALAGRPPFPGDDPVSVSYRHAHEAAVPLSSVAPGVDAELERLVMRCLAKDPDQRPASAAEVATTLGSIAGRLARGGEMRAVESEDETVAIPIPPPPAAVAPPVEPPTVPSWSPARPRPAPYYAAPELGVAPPTRRRAGDDGPSGGILVALLGLAVFVVGTLLALLLFWPRGDNGTSVVPTARVTERPGAVITPELLPATDVPPRATEPPAATQPPATQPPATERPATEPPATEPPAGQTEPPPATDPPVTEPPVTEPPAGPTEPPAGPTEPPPATEPPATEPPPPAEPEELRAEIEDVLFTGDFHGESNGTYHGRSASWVYGQGTEFHTMSADFRLDGQIEGPATLEIVGLDGENPIKNNMSVTINGVTIYQGPNPLPDDVCCGPSGPGNWGSAVFEIPADVLRRNNTLAISNLEESDCTTCPKYVMVDVAVVEYTARR